jgi:hypothetical protein
MLSLVVEWKLGGVDSSSLGGVFLGRYDPRRKRVSASAPADQRADGKKYPAAKRDISSWSG